MISFFTSTSPIVLRLSSASSRSDRVDFPDMRSVVPCRKEIEKEALFSAPPALLLLSRMHVTFCRSNSAAWNTAALLGRSSRWAGADDGRGHDEECSGGGGDEGRPRKRGWSAGGNNSVGGRLVHSKYNVLMEAQHSTGRF